MSAICCQFKAASFCDLKRLIFFFVLNDTAQACLRFGSKTVKLNKINFDFAFLRFGTIDRLLEIMDESNEINSHTSSQFVAANRKQILNYLQHKVDEQTDRMTNAQREIAALKATLSNAKQRIERMKNGKTQPQMTHHQQLN